ncbi:MAG: hypothetical protein GX749_00840 [Ruminococcaceae bacterium]|nr:hypothetical protein [Oscillospiraceae bacterium]
MAFTLEAALVLPLTISLILGTVPPAVNCYQQAVAAAGCFRQAARLTADPATLYLLAEVGAAPTGGSAAAGNSGGSAAAGREVLLTSPKLMFCLITAVIDDLKILGLNKP